MGKRDKKQAVIDKWVAALRSGEYKQIKHWLHSEDGYCCLGVLCDVLKTPMQPYNGMLPVGDVNPEIFMYNGKIKTLPMAVAQSAGLTSPNGNFISSAGVQDSLTGMNDRGCSFEQIADVIESRPTDLFME